MDKQYIKRTAIALAAIITTVYIYDCIRDLYKWFFLYRNNSQFGYDLYYEILQGLLCLLAALTIAYKNE
jgi:hypothetical protein